MQTRTIGEHSSIVLQFPTDVGTGHWVVELATTNDLLWVKLFPEITFSYEIGVQILSSIKYTGRLTVETNHVYDLRTIRRYVDIISESTGIEGGPDGTQWSFAFQFSPVLAERLRLRNTETEETLSAHIL